jgi:Domain of unknown function (DU1801)
MVASRKKKAAKKPASAAQKGRARAAGRPKLLAGGNPQIAKGRGRCPRAGLHRAMPGWTREAGRRLDALIVRTVPGVREAVKWNSPFYGVEGRAGS